MKLIKVEDLQPNDRFSFLDSPRSYYMTSFPYSERIGKKYFTVLPCISLSVGDSSFKPFVDAETVVNLHVDEQLPKVVRKVRKVQDLNPGDLFSLQNSGIVYKVISCIIDIKERYRPKCRLSLIPVGAEHCFQPLSFCYAPGTCVNIY